jgi:hypothetical protein
MLCDIVADLVNQSNHILSDETVVATEDSNYIYQPTRNATVDV